MFMYQHQNFTYKLENRNIPVKYSDIVQKPEHRYPVQFSSLNCTLRKHSLTNGRFAIFFGGPKL